MLRFINLSSASKYLVLFSFFFPWVNFNLTNFDTQPTVILFGIIYLLSSGKFKIPSLVFYIFLFNILGLFFASILYPAQIFSSLWMRAFISYLTFPVVFCCMYDVCKKNGVPWNCIFVFNTIWIIFGLLDRLFPKFVDMFVVARSSDDRGVSSLAAEPSFFGLVLIVFNILYLFQIKQFSRSDYDVLSPKVFKTFIVVNCLTIIVLAQSFSSLVVAIGYVLWFVSTIQLTSRTVHKLLALAVTSVLVALPLGMMSSVLLGGRILTLMETVYDVGIWSLIILDGSANQRFDGILSPNYLLLHNGFLPGGFNNYISIRENYDILFDLFWYPPTDDKILSWLGAANFELGVFGLISSALSIYLASLCTKKSFIFVSFFVIFLLSPLPHASPFVGVICAISFHFHRATIDEKRN